MGLTRHEALKRGINIPEHLWPDKSSGIKLPELPPPPSRFAEDGMTKLERDWWTRANEAKDKGILEEVMREPMRFKVFGDRWYKPDFLIWAPMDAKGTFWETKGYERAKDIQKLIAAADRYGWYDWVLAKRVNQRWECRWVTNQGIDSVIWKPDWLF